MNIIMASSRGKSLQEHFNKRSDVKMVSVGGGRLQRLSGMAISELRCIDQGQQSKPIVYFVAGLPDITVMTRRYCPALTATYEEVTFTQTPLEELDSFKQKLNNVSDHIISNNAIPCFSTIAPSDISTWNHTRLRQHKTSHLLHFQTYPQMQENLIEAIILIKRTIFEMNIANGIHT